MDNLMARKRLNPAASRPFTVGLVEVGPVTDGPSPNPTIAVPQIAVDDLAAERNLDRIRERVAALPNRVDVAVLPEYALTGFVADERIREVAFDRAAAVDRLSAIADGHDVAVVAGYAERGDEADDGGSADPRDVYNATAYVPPDAKDGSTTGTTEPVVYRKRHLWGEEAEHVTAGTERVIVDTPAGPTGLLTCYDLNFVAESAWFTDRAVDALFVPGAWPAAHAANWRLLLRARAIDGVRWVVGAGRTGAGEDDAGNERSYAGNSLVARPDGRIGAEIGRDERDLIVTLDGRTLDAQRDLVGSVQIDRK